MTETDNGHLKNKYFCSNHIHRSPDWKMKCVSVQKLMFKVHMTSGKEPTNTHYTGEDNLTENPQNMYTTYNP